MRHRKIAKQSPYFTVSLSPLDYRSANSDNRNNAEGRTESDVRVPTSQARCSRLNGSLHGLSMYAHERREYLSRLAISRENWFHPDSRRASRVTMFHATSGPITARSKYTLLNLLHSRKQPLTQTDSSCKFLFWEEKRELMNDAHYEKKCPMVLQCVWYHYND